MAKPIINKRREVTAKGNIIVIVAWRVEKTKFCPEGIKYSFAFLHNNYRLIAFDNFNNEGHHKHYLGNKENINFISLKKIAEDFYKLIEKYEREM